MTPQDRIDRLARELYRHAGHCGACRRSVPLAEALRFRCPHCGGLYLPGPDVTPERGRAMLAELQARRRALGLPGGR